MWLDAIIDWLRVSAALRDKVSQLEVQDDALREELARLKPIPTVGEFSANCGTVLGDLAHYNLAIGNRGGGLWDDDYWFTTLDEMRQVLKHSNARLPAWVKDRKDCESWGWALKGILDMDYGYNYSALCIGKLWVDYMPDTVPAWMSHGWLVFRADGKLWGYDGRFGEDIWEVGKSTIRQEQEVYL